MKKRIQRFLISWYSISDKPMPNWLRSACDKDIGLQLDLEEEQRLSGALKNGYEGHVESPDNQSIRRILEELGEGGSSEPEVKASPWKEIAIGVAACVGIAIAIQWGRVSTESHEEVVLEIESSPRDLSKVWSLAEADWKNPLDKEMENVLSDAQGAIDFLHKFEP